MLWPIFLLEVPGHWFRHHGIIDSNQIPTDKKSIVTDTVRNLIMGMFGSSNRTKSKYKPQKQHKMEFTGHKTKLLQPFQFSE